ncbi:MAG: hypothetical protein ACXW6J_19015 [Candidatus Binatia bacterium]
MSICQLPFSAHSHDGFGFRLFVARPAFSRAKDSSATLEHFIERSLPRNFCWCVAVLSLTTLLEITETYKLFARSFSDENLITTTPHVEFLIDKQCDIRARWLPAESEAWSEIAGLLTQVELLRKEKPRAAAPDDHVH